MKSVSAVIMALIFGVIPNSASALERPSFMENLTDDQFRATIDFMIGNLMLVYFHEAGHMMIHELDLPVLSKEEDAVDTLATITLLEDGDDYSDQAVTNAAASWAGFGQDSEASGEKPIYWDVHGLAQQRAFNMACLMYGKDPVKFTSFADAIELPKERRDTCAGEYNDMIRGWSKVLSGHLLKVENKNSFEVSYGPTENPELQVFADIVKNSDVLTLLSNAISGHYDFQPGIKISAKECGIENAFWAPETREITFCYELMSLHAKQFVRASGY